MENLENLQNRSTFLQTLLLLEAWNFQQSYCLARPFRSCMFLMTFIQGQSLVKQYVHPYRKLKCGHYGFLRHHDHYSRKTWHNGRSTPWQDLPEHINFDDLYLRIRPFGPAEILENTIAVIFSDSSNYSLSNYTCLDNLQPRSRSWPSAKVKVINANW